MAARQANEPFVTLVSASLSDAPLEVRSLRAVEGVGRINHYELVLALPTDQAEPSDVINSSATIVIEAWEGGGPSEKSNRNIFGVVSKVWVATDADSAGIWILTVVPRLWLLTQSRNSRVFQDLTVREIIEAVCQESGVDVEFKVNGGPVSTPRPFTCQFAESNYQFITRLAEDCGLLHCISHSSGADVVTYQDALDKFEDATPLKRQPWILSMGASESLPESVNRLEFETQLRPEEVVISDYNYENAGSPLEADEAIAGGASGSVRIHQGGFFDSSGATDFAALRAEEIAGDVARYVGGSSCRSMIAGGVIEITGESTGYETPFGLESEPLALLEVQHNYDDGSYRNSFVAVQLKSHYRLPRTTARPKIHGIQTALVEGHSGEKVMTDELGRVKVRFRWDSAGAAAGETSCWIRVAQSYAGADHGGYVIPRVGDEVVVAFEEGDPDRPLIVGSVYNSECKLPSDMPSEDHHSVFLTPNGLKFHVCDKDGSEECHLYTPDGKHNIVVEAGQKVDLTAQDAITTVGKSKFSLTTDDAIDVTGKATIKIDGSGDVTVNGGANVVVEGAQDVTIKGGMNVKIEGSLEVSITAGSGAGSIKIDPAGNITLQGTMINLSANAILGLKGAMVQVN